MKNSISILIGSESERKIACVVGVVRKLTKGDIVANGFKAASGVPETPYGKETYVGANNRAQHCTEGGKASYYVGLESGLVKRYGSIYEEAWCAVIANDGSRYYGYSSGLRIPDYILNEMKRKELKHFEVMALLQEKHGILPNDTWGNYSANMITRENSLEEAVRNAFIQIFAPKESFYKMSSTRKK